MTIRPATPPDLDVWAEMRAGLWPEASIAEHRQEAEKLLRRSSGDAIVLVAIDDELGVGAFVEASLRRDYVNGCDTSPVAFIEGIYVAQERRGTGIGRLLARAVEVWAREQGCHEIASDALLDNVDSHAFQEAIGFEKTERVVYFRRLL